MATVIIGILLAVGAINGLRRGVIKEGTALIGVLLGALLAQGWAAPWAAQLTRGSDVIGSHSLVERSLTLGLLIGVALLTGYGSGVWLPRRVGTLTSRQRIGGGLLGFVNMGLLVGFALTFIEQLWYTLPARATMTTPLNNSAPGTTGTTGTLPTTAVSWIRQAPLPRFLLERLGLLLVGVAVAFALLAVLVGVFKLLRAMRRPTVVPAPAGAGKPLGSPTVAPTLKPATPTMANPIRPSTAATTPSPVLTTPTAGHVASSVVTPAATEAAALKPLFQDDPLKPGGSFK